MIVIANLYRFAQFKHCNVVAKFVLNAINMFLMCFNLNVLVFYTNPSKYSSATYMYTVNESSVNYILCIYMYSICIAQAT